MPLIQLKKELATLFLGVSRRITNSDRKFSPEVKRLKEMRFSLIQMLTNIDELIKEGEKDV